MSNRGVTARGATRLAQEVRPGAALRANPQALPELLQRWVPTAAAVHVRLGLDAPTRDPSPPAGGVG
ncbi:hypothetical protein [Kineococcus arenarius]|uniref:hypothetical protein n=1 Tax=unclassified Kineococcus TaxID=2621656 RepID=UPI003D7E8EFF